MVPWSQLLLPILLSAVFVFVASSVIHMVLKLHNPDYRKLPNEDEVRAALNKGAPPPGQYVLPHCLDPKEMENRVMAALRDAFKPEFLNRVDETIIFNSLGREQIKSIVEIQLKGLRRNLAARKLALEISERAKAL